jgi:ABC-type sugar transport system permease subunit
MPRRLFDIILTAVGAVLTVVLLVAGALLMWGYSFANSNVLKPPEIGKYLDKYAGQQLTSGDQAEAYADHFIKVHLDEIAGGQTYAQVSTQAQANPNDAALQAKVQTLFRGETLRGMLLNAYAFWQLGQIALAAAIASFILGAIMLVLTVLGLMRLRARPAEQMSESGGTPITSPAAAG